MPEIPTADALRLRGWSESPGGWWLVPTGLRAPRGRRYDSSKLYRLKQAARVEGFVTTICGRVALGIDYDQEEEGQTRGAEDAA